MGKTNNTISFSNQKNRRICMIQIERMSLICLWQRMLVIVCRCGRDDSTNWTGELLPFSQSSDCRLAAKTNTKPVSTAFFFHFPVSYFSSSSLCRLWIHDVAVPDKIIGVVDVLCPKRPKVLKTDLQPWFWLAIVVDNCSLFHALNAGFILIPQSEHVPRWVYWMNMTSKCY